MRVPKMTVCHAGSGRDPARWYVFPFGRPRPNDPTRPVTTLKTAWQDLREKRNVIGRWHDNGHTLVTELAESGANDQTAWTSLGTFRSRSEALQSHSDEGKVHGPRIHRGKEARKADRTGAESRASTHG